MVVKTQVLKGTFDLQRSSDGLALVLRRVLGSYAGNSNGSWLRRVALRKTGVRVIEYKQSD